MFSRKKLIKNVETKSEPYDPKLFPTINQTTTVTVTVEQADDGIAECIKGCFSCCVSGAKIAAKS
jgi:hypothetical protein